LKAVSERYDKQTRVPGEWVVENAKTTTIAHQVWEKARAEKNFELFRPHLEHVIDLRRRLLVSSSLTTTFTIRCSTTSSGA
jgi:carboxypeptidase Taq